MSNEFELAFISVFTQVDTLSTDETSEARPIRAKLDFILAESVLLDIHTKVQTSQITQHRRIV